MNTSPTRLLISLCILQYDCENHHLNLEYQCSLWLNGWAGCLVICQNTHLVDIIQGQINNFLSIKRSIIKMQTEIIATLHKTFKQYKLRSHIPEKKVVMSSVAMIIRVNPTINTTNIKYEGGMQSILEQLRKLQVTQQQNKQQSQFYEILFLQRAFNTRDSNPGQICFPGGKCENGQSDLQAAQRETLEQTGLKLDRRLLIGKVPKAFYARQTKTHYLYLTAYIFLLLPQLNEAPLTLNIDEVVDYRWIDLITLLAPKEKLIELNVRHPSFLVRLTENLSKQYGIQQSRLESCFEGAIFPALDLSMSLPLFGLTFYIFIEVLRHIVKGNTDRLTHANLIGHTNKFLEKSITLSIQFSKDLERGKQITERVLDEYKRLRILPNLLDSRL